MGIGKVAGTGFVVLSTIAIGLIIDKGEKINDKMQQKARDGALKYATPAQVAKLDSTIEDNMSFRNTTLHTKGEAIHFYDALASQGKAAKAYQEGAQMVRDSIAMAAKRIKP